MRYTVARIIRKTLESLNLNYPLVDEEEKARFEEMKGVLSQVGT